MFREHRQRLLEILRRENAACVIPAGVPPVRNADTEYRFRPASDFYWLTGFREPDCVLVLAPASEEAESVLFLREKDTTAEIWDGRRLGVEAAPEALGVADARPIDDLWDELPELLIGHERLVYALGVDPDRDRHLTELVRELEEGKGKRGEVTPREIRSPRESLHELRLFKDRGEVDLMRRAAEVTAEAHVEAMRAAAAGVNEAEIDALLDYTFRRRGGTGSAYNNIVAGGVNACILHYIENDQPLADGDLLLIDAGCEWSCYASDVTRTFPVSGRFSDEQRALYEVVLRAQKEAIECVAPGRTHVEVHDRAVDVLVDGLLELGLLKDPKAKVLEDETYRRFYMHRTGHWLGLDVHDCGRYYDGEAARPFAPGMVTTVEPGLYVARDDDTVDERWRGIGIRIEDDVLVTEAGHDVLSAAAPKEVEEVEAVCRGETLARV